MIANKIIQAIIVAMHPFGVSLFLSLKVSYAMKPTMANNTIGHNGGEDEPSLRSFKTPCSPLSANKGIVAIIPRKNVINFLLFILLLIRVGHSLYKEGSFSYSIVT